MEINLDPNMCTCIAIHALQYKQLVFFLGFPKVLGCVDGTQIRISTPTANEADFVNRKGFHSLNVQVLFINVCTV